MAIRWVTRWIAAALSPLAVMAQAPVAFGDLGDNLAGAMKTDFFTFFHLEKTGETPAGGGRVVTFHPSGPSFRDLVTFEAHLDAAGHFQMIELTLTRAFIDGRQGIFARDIVKSFLRQATPAKDLPVLTDLIDEIQNTVSGGTTVIRSPSAPSRLPEKPTLGHQVYIGKLDRWEQKLSTLTLQMRNASVGGSESFITSYRAR